MMLKVMAQICSGEKEKGYNAIREGYIEAVDMTFSQSD